MRPWFLSLRAGVPLADAGDFRHEGTHHLSLRELLYRLVAGLDVVATCFFTQHPGFEALVVFLARMSKLTRSGCEETLRSRWSCSRLPRAAAEDMRRRRSAHTWLMLSSTGMVASL